MFVREYAQDTKKLQKNPQTDYEKHFFISFSTQVFFFFFFLYLFFFYVRLATYTPYANMNIFSLIFYVYLNIITFSLQNALLWLYVEASHILPSPIIMHAMTFLEPNNARAQMKMDLKLFLVVISFFMDITIAIKFSWEISFFFLERFECHI